MSIFQCNPIYGFWAAQLRDPDCTAANSILVGTAAPNTAIDFVILFLPFPVVWKMQLSTRRKLYLSAIFLIGALYVARPLSSLVLFMTNAQQNSVCVASVMRLWAVAQVDKARKGDSSCR